MKFNKKVLSLIIIVAMLAGNLAILPFVIADEQNPKETRQVKLWFNGNGSVGTPSDYTGTGFAWLDEDHHSFELTALSGNPGIRLGEDVGASNDRYINATDYNYMFIDIVRTTSADGLKDGFNGLFLMNNYSDGGRCDIDFYPTIKAQGAPGQGNVGDGNNSSSNTFTAFMERKGLSLVPGQGRRYDDAKCLLHGDITKRPTAGLVRFDMSSFNNTHKDAQELNFDMGNSAVGQKLIIGGIWLSDDPYFSPKTTMKIDDPEIAGTPSGTGAYVTNHHDGSFESLGSGGGFQINGNVVNGVTEKIIISYYRYMYIDFAAVNNFHRITINTANDREMMYIRDPLRPQKMIASTDGATVKNDGVGKPGIIQIDLSLYNHDYFGRGQIDHTYINRIQFVMDEAGLDNPLKVNGIYFSNDPELEFSLAELEDEDELKTSFTEGDAFTSGGVLNETLYPEKRLVNPVISAPRQMSIKVNEGGDDFYKLFPLDLGHTDLIAAGAVDVTGTNVNDRKTFGSNPRDVLKNYPEDELQKLCGWKAGDGDKYSYNWFTYGGVTAPSDAAGEVWWNYRRCFEVIEEKLGPDVDITADMCTAYVKDGDPTDDAIDLTEPLEIGEYTVDVTYKNFSYSYDIEVLADDSESSDDSSESSSSESSNSESSSSEAGSGTTITNSDIDKTGVVNIRGEVGTDWIVVIPVGSTDIDLFDTDNEQLIGQLGVTSARLEADKKLVVTADSDDWKLSGVSEGNTTTGFSYSLTKADKTWEFTQVSNPLIDVEIILSEGAEAETPHGFYRDIITFTVEYVSQ